MKYKIISKLLSKFLTPNTRNDNAQDPTMSRENDIWTEERLRQVFTKCADIKIQNYEVGHSPFSQSVILVSCEGLTDTKQINQYVLPRLESMVHRSKFDPELSIELELVRINHMHEIVNCVFSGHLILIFSNINAIYSLDISDPPNRKPEESNTEISIKGPRDGFVESLQTNVALVRKRLRTTSLRYEQFMIGSRSECLVALLYIDDLVKPDIINEARKRLNNIEIDALLGTSQLEELITDSPYSVFPLLDSSGRPDFVVDSLVSGRFAVMVEGAPRAVIAPLNMGLLMKSPEDIYNTYLIVSFEMVIRFIGLIISLFLPGFWVALSSYNLEQVPFPLLATLVLARIGLPLPGPVEAFLILGLFELFREAGIRLPKGIGSTVAVVGGIIIGDAVIRAGLASTTMVIVSALTAVATFTIINQTLNGAVTILRFVVLTASSVLGMYGFILSSIGIVIYLAKLESFGVPYLTPLSPFKPKDWIASLIKKPLDLRERPQFLQEGKPKKQGGHS